MQKHSLHPNPLVRTAAPRGLRPWVALVLLAWFTLVVVLGAQGVFVGPPGQPPLAIALGVGLPLLVFFSALRYAPGFRSFVLGLDLQFVAGVMAWRVAGFGFIELYTFHLLPGLFAFPAGLGDMAIGFAAPWIVRALRQTGFAASARFVGWNVLGMADLVIAVSLGAVSATLTTGASGEISTAPMANLPLLLIPAFFVPLYLMLHTVALLQSRALRRERDDRLLQTVDATT